MALELAINRCVLFRQREMPIRSTPLRQAFDRPTETGSSQSCVSLSIALSVRVPRSE
jgi:hypothetical protein